ncbi:MAG: protein adenylyltransferase SelO [Planctomycetaceae bacterium]
MSTTVAEALSPVGRGWNLDNSYTRLPPGLFRRSRPLQFPQPRVVLLNAGLSRELGLDFDGLPETDLAEVLSGRRLPPQADPIAQAYAGHQFGGFSLLGDGRAILLGEQVTPGGARYDLQWKGSGPTAYSRRGDVRAALGPMLREYLISEAMQALRVPTTRSLAVLTTGDVVFREGPLPGAVLIRVAASHLRVGTFQLLLAQQDNDTLRHLADYTIARHDADLVDHPQKALEFLRRVIGRQARLIAQWQQLGFVHGVMNTDNMAVSGETIDYGPCAFLDAHDPATVFSSIDRQGRYAYGNQPAIAHWNLARLAESLLPLVRGGAERAVATVRGVLDAFPERFQRHHLAGARAKLGLTTAEAGDEQLFAALRDWMRETRADHTETFAGLARVAAAESGATRDGDARLREWRASWLARLDREPRGRAGAVEILRRTNPVVIPRNHRVEEALGAAAAGDLAPFERLLAALREPFVETATNQPYRGGPPPGCGPYRTFCGT